MLITIGKRKTPPVCPLCNKDMEYHTFMLPNEALELVSIEVFVCPRDKVMIKCDDPAVGMWENKLGDNEPVPCPNPKCGHDNINVFYTANFEYFKAVCPKCYASIACENINQLEELVNRALQISAQRKVEKKARILARRKKR